MALDAFQSIKLDGKVKKKGEHPLFQRNYSDIWRGEFVDPNELEKRASKIVIKLIKHTLNPEDVKELQMKLFQEAKVWTTLCHSNIVPLLGVTTTIGFLGVTTTDIWPTLGLVTPYYKNGNLKKYVSDGKHTFNLDNKMSLLYEVAAALDYLHTQNTPVIHGDVKPESVLIDDDGHAVLADVGLAMVLGPSQAQLTINFEDFRGTLHYLAPELLLVDDSKPMPRPTPATDVWSFGILATQIFSTRTPYGTDRDSSVIDIVATKKETLKHEDYPEIHPDLWSGLEECWQWKPDKRVSMLELGEFITEQKTSYAEKGRASVELLDDVIKCVVLVASMIPQILGLGSLAFAKVSTWIGGSPP